jgi:hypothetical protein
MRSDKSFADQRASRTVALFNPMFLAAMESQWQVSSRGDAMRAGGDDQWVKGAWGGLIWRRCLIVQAAKGGRRADDRSTHGHRDILVY